MDIHREIAGSVEYINRTLAPEKKHARIFFWTGDGLADGEALALTRLLGSGEYERRWRNDIGRRTNDDTRAAPWLQD